METKPIVSPCPCKDCITYVICKLYIKDLMPPEPIDPAKDSVFLILSMSILKGLALKCSLIRKYIEAYVKRGNSPRVDSIYATTLLLHILHLGDSDAQY
jgi:hypothetical protein